MGADEKFVAALPRVKLSEAASVMLSDGGGDNGICNICLAEYEAGDELVCIPCRGLHKFHAGCAAAWLKTASTCPCCQWVVPKGQSASERTELMKTAKDECERLAAARLPPCLLC